MRKYISFPLLFVSSVATAGPWLKSGTTWHPVDFACELPDFIVTMEGSGNPGHPDDTLTYHGMSKLDPTSSITLTSPFSVVGADGCGAGHCEYDFPNGGYTYSINEVSPGIIDESIDAGSIRVERAGTALLNETCRIVTNAIAECITSNRAVYVIDDGSGAYSYEDYDVSNRGTTASLALGGGSLSTDLTSGNDVYSFASGPYSYELSFAPGTASAGFGRLVVAENGHQLLSEDCVTYTAP